MDSLLRWGIEHSAPGAVGAEASQQPPQPRPRQDLDPAILDVILGKPDAELMKEALSAATDETKDVDARLTALDDFEMLVEQIDNANNIAAMGMWPTIHRLLYAPKSTDDIKANTLWIIGTAVQNNPAAQKAYLSTIESPLEAILSFLSPEESSRNTRTRAIYALSGLLKHNTDAVRQLSSIGGWDILKSALEDPDITVRRKAAFLLNSLLLPSALAPSSSRDDSTAQFHGETAANARPVHPHSHASMTAESAATSELTSKALTEHGFPAHLVQSLLNPLPHGPDGENEGDADFEEKLVRLLLTYLTDGGGKLDEIDKTEMRNWVQERRNEGEHWDLGQSELEKLQRALA